MQSEYIEQRNGGYYLAGTRISLRSVVWAFNQGYSPERIMESYPLIGRVSRVYGAIAFYLDHKEEIDQHLEESLRQFEASCEPLEQANPALWERLQRAKAKLGEPRT
jgi:uncharacterized protein (DUF433 family)